VQVLIAAVFLLMIPQPPKPLIGTVTAVRADAGEIDVRPDAGDQVKVAFTADTLFQRVAPGEKNLQNAAAIKAGDLAAGDRVLVALDPLTRNARRVVVMSGNEIARRNEADRRDWVARGISGTVTAWAPGKITLKLRSIGGETTAAVTVDQGTSFKRYAPDSVLFADAKPSSLAEVNVGDQLRARGSKSEDGLEVAADEIVFGTFVTRAGTIAAVNAAAGEVTLKELGSEKPLLVKISSQSQLRRMPAFGGMGGGMPGGGPPGGGPSGGGMAGRPGGGPPDMAQMLERMPAAKLEELKPGETVVVSSTKGARNDQITAITFLSNAETLLRMVSARSGSRQGSNEGGMSMGGGMMGGGMSGASGSLGGFELPSMIP
jgi:hypothetical protein